MSTTSLKDQHTTTWPLSGFVIGFVDTEEQCQEIRRDLANTGVALDRIDVINGKSGLNVFHQRMQGFGWGEESEQMLRVGERELESNHFALFVEAKERGEGMQIAEIAKRHGGHGLRHFGELTDERLTP